MYSENLKLLRERNGLTQKSIANLIGIQRGPYSQYELEYIIIPLKHLNTICNYFNVSLDYIFNFTKSKQHKNCIKDINKKLSGQRIKELRTKNNLKQIELAEFLNVGQSTIAEIERGTNIIATPFLYSICKKYKISADYLLGRIDKKPF